MDIFQARILGPTKWLQAGKLDVGYPIHRIPNGVDVQRFEQESLLYVYEHLGVPPDSNLIVTIGNYHSRKGQEFLVQSMQEILESDSKARLVIIWGGQEPLKHVVEELNLQDAVILARQIPVPVIRSNSSDVNDWLAAILQESKVYVSASRNEEAGGLSLALLEAMAVSLPVVATDISGNRDIVYNGSNGFLVPQIDSSALVEAALKLLLNKELCSIQSQNAKAVA